MAIKGQGNSSLPVLVIKTLTLLHQITATSNNLMLVAQEEDHYSLYHYHLSLKSGVLYGKFKI